MEGMGIRYIIFETNFFSICLLLFAHQIQILPNALFCMNMRNLLKHKKKNTNQEIFKHYIDMFG